MGGRKQELKAEMTAVREKTLWLLSQVPEEFLKQRVHSFYSPVGWHFGHIARTEEFWILVEALRQPCLDQHYTFLFADLPENPKDNRVNLPSREEIVAYLAAVRTATFRALDDTVLDATDLYLADGYAWEFALQHECQHQETICEMLQLIQLARGEHFHEPQTEPSRGVAIPQSEFVTVPAGTFCMGSDDPRGYDNERQAHEVHVGPFELARTPVTVGEWQRFMEDGGYRRPELWSAEGWEWRAQEGAVRPEYWIGNDTYAGPLRPRTLDPMEAVSCVSWFEADAFARWAEARLPTEAEWEYAARGPRSRHFPWGIEPPQDRACFGMTSWGPTRVGAYPVGASPFGILDMAGNVWEWTSTPFLPYPGFKAFPYDGYSKDHMKGAHKVCRGGSWATSARILRCSFRNWYVPSYRQGFLGVRLAR